MTTCEFAQLVYKWFDAAGQGGGPLLPDGWFGGRAYENTFFLQDVQAFDDALVVELSEDTTLRFDCPGHVFIENSDPVFDGFRRVTLRWKNYGGGANASYRERIYDEGQVRIAAPVGMKIDLQ